MATENSILKFINESRDKLIKVLLSSIIGYMIISVFIIVSFSYGKGYSENQECFIKVTLGILVVFIFGILFTIWYLNRTSFISKEIIKKTNKEESFRIEMNKYYAEIDKASKDLLLITANIKTECENVKNLSNSLKTEINEITNDNKEIANEIKEIANEINKSKPDDIINKADT